MRIGVIAGSGQFPLIFSKKAKQNGDLVYALGLIDETDPDIGAFVENFKWVDLGQVQQMIHYLKQHQISRAVMLGARGQNQDLYPCQTGYKKPFPFFPVWTIPRTMPS